MQYHISWFSIMCPKSHLVNFKHLSTNFMSLVSSYTPWKHKKPNVFVDIEQLLLTGTRSYLSVNLDNIAFNILKNSTALRRIIFNFYNYLWVSCNLGNNGKTVLHSELHKGHKYSWAFTSIQVLCRRWKKSPISLSLTEL